MRGWRIGDTPPCRLPETCCVPGDAAHSIQQFVPGPKETGRSIADRHLPDCWIQITTKWKDERASVVRPRGLPEAAAVQKIEALLCSHQDFAKNTFALVEIQIAIRDMNVVPIFRFLQRPLMKRVNNQTGFGIPEGNRLTVRGSCTFPVRSVNRKAV